MHPNLQQVIEQNRLCIESMQELNVRAGENLFHVPTAEELEEFFKNKLSGARCAREVRDFSELLLPEADCEMAELVRKENPDSLVLLSREVVIKYEAGQPPTVTFNLADFVNNEWAGLPNELKLPNGKQVRVRIILGIFGSVIEETNLIKLKYLLLDYLNREKWEKWVKPVVSAPDFSKENSIADITEYVYGKCVVTHKPLYAFGTFVYCASGITDSAFYQFQWFRDQEDALKAHVEAKGMLNSVRREILLVKELHAEQERKEQERTIARQEFARLKSRIDELYSLIYSQLKDSLKSELYEYSRSLMPYLLSELASWNQGARDIIERVEKYIANSERKKAAELDEAVQKKLTLVAAAIGPVEANTQGDFVYRVFAFVEQAIEIAGGFQKAYNLLRPEHEKEVYGKGKRQKSIMRNFPGIDLQDLDWMPGKDIVPVLKWLEKQLIDSGVELTKPLFSSPKVPVENIDLTKLFLRFGKQKK